MTERVKTATLRRRHRGRDRPRPARGTVPGGVWLYGLHAVLAAIGNPRRQCLRLLATADSVDRLAVAVSAAAALRPAVEAVDRAGLAVLLPAGAVHQGMAALVAPLPSLALDAVAVSAERKTDLRLLVLDQVTDPRNVGAVLRAGAAFSVDAVIVQDRHSPEESGALAKAASGALETVPLVRVTNLARALRSLRAAEVRCIGLDATAPLALPHAPLGGRIALVLGAEGSGLRRLVRESCDRCVRIPIDGTVDSLNVATAAAIALYEIARGTCA